MARRVVWYGMAAVFPAVLVAAGVGPFRCGIYGCTGGSNPTLQTFVLGAALGAVIGLLAMAVIDLVINGRYVLANRVEAKAQRLRNQSQGPTDPNPLDVPGGPRSETAGSECQFGPTSSREFCTFVAANPFRLDTCPATVSTVIAH